MKLASDRELDVGLDRAYQSIFDLRQLAMKAKSTHEATQIQERLELAIEELDLIEREQIRRLGVLESVHS